MTENERRIVTLLSKFGPLSKKELMRRGGMSWATVVKIIARFDELGMVRFSGTEPQATTTGIDPALYELTDRKPLAVGIDVDYSSTHIILSNLKHDILAQRTYTTPKSPDKGRLQEFLASIFAEFTENALTPQDELAGVGIGFPRWLVKNGLDTFSSLSYELSEQLQVPVRVENCIRSYTLYHKWLGKAFEFKDFVALDIRDGVGTGIFYQGQLFRGANGVAGGLSHITVEENGTLCRCGKHGCLENQISWDVLYHKYISQIQQQSSDLQKSPSDAEMHQGVSQLFSLANQGHPEAVSIVHEAARYIGMGLATLLMIMDIPHIIIGADFGAEGHVIIPLIEQEIQRRVTPDIAYSVIYSPLEWKNFAQGAPLLIFADYFTDVEAGMSR